MLCIIPLCFITTDNATIPMITVNEGILWTVVCHNTSTISFILALCINPAITVARNKGAAGASNHLNVTLGSPPSLNHVA